MAKGHTSSGGGQRVRSLVSGTSLLGCFAVLGVALPNLPAHDAVGASFSGHVARDAATTQTVGFGGGSNKPFHVAALGDSVPSGLGSTSFVNLVGTALGQQTDRPAQVDDEAVSGLDSGGVLASLKDRNSGASVAVSQADVTVIEVGANDFDEDSAKNSACAPVQVAGCYDDDMASMKSNVRSIVDLVKQRGKPSNRIVLVGYWNTFKDGQAGQSVGSDYVTQGRELAQWINSSVKAIADDEDVQYADVYTPFFADGADPTSRLQADGDHPNETGHRIIADAVLEALGSSPRA